MSTPAPVALILEDEREIRLLVRMSLEAEGWEVFETGSVKQGLVEAGTRRPDLVIADLGLPDGDRFGFIRELRTWSGVPIIVLSARTPETDNIAALDAGADDFISRPFSIAACSPACAPTCEASGPGGRPLMQRSGSVTSRSTSRRASSVGAGSRCI